MCFCLVVGMTIFSACDFGSNPDNEITPPAVVKVPSELEVTGYSNEVVVGDEFITKLKVKAKIDGVWEEVAKADYTYICSYTGSKYGEYKFNVYLKDYPSVEHSDVIVVKPKTVLLPESFSTKYTGETIDIKNHYDSVSNGLYEVKTYMNMSNCGTYEVSLKLTNTDEYVWVDAEGNVLKNITQKVNWNITKANPQTYTGTTALTAYYGDTLETVAKENNLNNITWYMDSTNNPVNNNTVVTEGAVYYAYYNDNPQNYEDTLVTMNIVEYITVANYTVEYYFFDGTEYTKDDSLTSIINGNIEDVVSVVADEMSGYIFNSMISNTTGEILKRDGLVLRLYYDMSN